MADRTFVVDVDLLGNQIKRVRIENLADDPTGADLYEGRLWFDTTANTLKTYAGGSVQPIAMGSGGGGGGTLRRLTDADGTPGDAVIFQALVGDVGGTIQIEPTDENDPPRVLLLPAPEAVPINRGMRVRFQGVMAFSEQLLQIGGDPEGGVFNIAFDYDGPFGGLNYGETVDLLKTQIYDLGGGSFAHVWSVVGGRFVEGGGSGGDFVPTPDPVPAYGRLFMSDGAGGLLDAGVSVSDLTGSVSRPVVVGNATEGDTLADCDYLDQGDGTELINACNVGRLQFKTTEVQLRPGRYPLTVFDSIAPYLSDAIPDLLLRAWPLEAYNAATLVIGDNRSYFYFGFAGYPLLPKLILSGVQVEVSAIETAASGDYIFGDGFGNTGEVILENGAAVYFNDTDDINESLKSVAAAANITLRSGGYVSGPGALQQLGRAEPFITLAANEVNLSNQSSVYGGDIIIRSNRTRLLDRCTVSAQEGTAAIQNETFYSDGKCTVSGPTNGACMQAQYGSGRVQVDANDTEFSSNGANCNGIVGADGFARDCVFRGLVDGVQPFPGDFSTPARPFAFQDCQWFNVRRRSSGTLRVDLEETNNPLVTFEPLPLQIGLNSFALGYHRGPEGTILGAAEFHAHLLCRPGAYPSDFEFIFGNYNRFQTDGGFGFGATATMFKFLAARNSDGTYVENFAAGLCDFAQYQGRFIDRTFLLSMYVSGTSCYCFINGDLCATLALTGGFKPAPVGNRPMIGRNKSVAFPAYNASISFVSAAYMEGPLGFAPAEDMRRESRIWTKNSRIMPQSFTPSDLWTVPGTIGEPFTELGSVAFERVDGDGTPINYSYPSMRLPMPVRYP